MYSRILDFMKRLDLSIIPDSGIHALKGDLTDLLEKRPIGD